MTVRKAPPISVVMAVYNAERYVQAGIESILHQTFSEFELIIVDDGSTDATAALLEQLARRDVRIRLFYNAANCGLTCSLNRALTYARGCSVARMDADDISHPQRLERQIACFEKSSNLMVIGTGTNLIDEDDLPIARL